MSTMERDSGAGAYSKTLVMVCSVHADVVGGGVVAGAELLPLQEQVVEQAGGAEPEPVRSQPVGAGRLVDQDEVLDRVLRRPDPAGRLDADLAAGGGAEVADRLGHDQGDRQGGGGRALAGGGRGGEGGGAHRRAGGAAGAGGGDQRAALPRDPVGGG